MTPSMHFLIAVAPILAYTLLQYQQLPSKAVVSAALVGGLFPDLVDKPLAYALFVIPNGRVFMHSMPFALPLSAIVCWYGWKTDRINIAGAFTVGFLLHPFGDFYEIILYGSLPENLLWPLLPTTPVSTTPAWAMPWSIFSALALTVLLGVLIQDIWIQIRHRS